MSVPFIETIHTTAATSLGKAKPIRFVQVNVGNGVNEQMLVNFEKRGPKHVEDLVAMKPDIVTLQEMRTFGTPIPSTKPPMIPECKIKPRDFLHMCSSALDHDVIFARRNAGELAFGQAILYDPRRFFLKQEVRRWLSTTPTDVSSESHVPLTEGKTESKERKQPGWGSLVLMAEFNYVHDGKIVWSEGKLPSFWVVNVHFPLDAATKLKCMRHLVEIIRTDCWSGPRGDDVPVIVSGDMNTFYDMPAVEKTASTSSGEEQLKVLLGAGFADVTTKIMSRDKVANTGTFLGFDSDAFKKPPTGLSHLDHICVTPHFALVGETATLWATQSELDTRSTPSDHLAVLVELTCPW